MDSSTGKHTTMGEDSPPQPVPNKGQMQAINNTKNIGVNAPLVRINDRYYGEDQIDRFELRT